MHVKYQSYTHRAKDGTAVPLHTPTLQDSYSNNPAFVGTMQDIPEHLHGVPNTLQRIGYQHANTKQSRKSCETPTGYKTVLAVQVRPIGANVAPITIGWLCTEDSGKRVYRRVSLKTGKISSRVTGINRRYQKHIKLDYLAHIASVDIQRYEIVLKSLKSFTPCETATETDTSKRTQKVCASMAGTRKQPAAKPNRKPVKPLWLPPERF